MRSTLQNFTKSLMNKRTFSETKKYPRSSGVIVLDKNKTVLVSSKEGVYSFPKGKREGFETEIETAWRELEEETGMKKNDIKLMDNYKIDEVNKNGKVATTYFVGKPVKNINEFKYNKQELEKVEWVNIDDALKLDKLKPERKNILSTIKNLFGNN